VILFFENKECQMNELNDFTFVKLPKPTAMASGMKVSWRLYEDLKDAQLASVAAVFNGYHRMQDGFDAGYLTPGSIEKIGAKNRYDNPEYEGMYEVVIL
jgi:hypothetical protein